MHPDSPSTFAVSFGGAASRWHRRTLVGAGLLAALAGAWLAPSPYTSNAAPTRRTGQEEVALVARFNATSRAALLTRCRDWPAVPESVRQDAAFRELIVAQQAYGDRDAADLTPPGPGDVGQLEREIGAACAARVAHPDDLAVAVVPAAYAADPSLHS